MFLEFAAPYQSLNEARQEQDAFRMSDHSACNGEFSAELISYEMFAR